MLNDSWAGRNPTKGCSADWRRRIKKLILYSACLCVYETDFTQKTFYKLKSYGLRQTQQATLSSCVLLAVWWESNTEARLVQTYNQGRLNKKRLYSFKNKANARVGTAARICSCESRTFAQKPTRNRQLLRQVNQRLLVAYLGPRANAELALKIHIALNASNATLPRPKPNLIISSKSSKFLHNAALQI
jgi:hypothetical protein